MSALYRFTNQANLFQFIKKKMIPTGSFFGSLSISSLVNDSLIFKLRDKANNPPALISFSLRSNLINLLLSAITSAMGTTPTHRMYKNFVFLCVFVIKR